MFDREEKFCIKSLNFLYDNYKNVETQYSVNYFKRRVIVSGDEEFCYDELFLNFLEGAFNNLKLSNVESKSRTTIKEVIQNFKPCLFLKSVDA